jgi:hypothetical protein
MAHHPTGSLASTRGNIPNGYERRETAAVKTLEAAGAWADDDQWQAGLASKWGDGPGLWSLCKQFG